jgi:hypothetical protein
MSVVLFLQNDSHEFIVWLLVVTRARGRYGIGRGASATTSSSSSCLWTVLPAYQVFTARRIWCTWTLWTRVLWLDGFQVARLSTRALRLGTRVLKLGLRGYGCQRCQLQRWFPCWTTEFFYLLGRPVSRWWLCCNRNGRKDYHDENGVGVHFENLMVLSEEMSPNAIVHVSITHCLQHVTDNEVEGVFKSVFKGVSRDQPRNTMLDITGFMCYRRYEYSGCQLYTYNRFHLLSDIINQLIELPKKAKKDKKSNASSSAHIYGYA